MAQRSREQRRLGASAVGGGVTARLFVVCDHAAVSPDQKLYINGANIDRMWFRQFPGPISQGCIAALLEVPWHLTSEPHHIRIRLLDADRAPIGPDPILDARAEVGRPPGARPGEEFGLPIAWALNG